MKKKKILVAMSGGVDSSVAAALLQEAGHEVAGATIRTWASNSCADLNTRACCGISGVEDARDVAATLGIPYWVLNFEKQFKEHVVDYFAGEYQKGRTPNPCIACNEHIKFRLFLEKAREFGYDYIATGHYAEVAADEKTGRYYLKEGKDAVKDQAYVLFPLGQEVLSRLFLPLGGFSKSVIRQKASELNLCVKDKPDSQEICFIPSNDYGKFLEKEYLGPGEPGEVKLSSGEKIGEHEGYFHFTRGQRRGLRIPFKEKLYVLATDPRKNEVIVGTKKEVFNRECVVGRVNWFLKPALSSPLKCHVKIRSQHKKAAAEIRELENQSIHVSFDQPQDAITTGQGAVFYDGTSVLGGGWIDRVI